MSSINKVPERAQLQVGPLPKAVNIPQFSSSSDLFLPSHTSDMAFPQQYLTPQTTNPNRFGSLCW